MSYDPNDAKSIFLRAAELPTESERAAFLEQVCAGKPELKARIESLLKTAFDPDSLLDQPVADFGATQVVSPDASPVSLEFLEPCEVPGRLGRLGGYEVIEVIGRGGMGIVLRAMDVKLNRVVAIKVLAPELASNPQARKRFLREAQAAAAVSHDHVVTIHAVDDDEKVPFLVMECVVGQSLQQKIDKVGALGLKEILRIGMQIASGLAAAHKQGLVHRDIKPANVLLENGVERVKITDFGLARATDDVGITQSGQIAGTPQYMSPEQAMGQPVDQRSDLFSLGSVLYTLCTGRPAFRADSAVAVLRRVCDDTPRPIGEVNAEVPDWLIAIVNRLMAKKPEDRIQTAAEVAELLSQHLAHLQQPATVKLPVSPLPFKSSVNAARRFGSRRMAWAIAVSVLVLLMALIRLATQPIAHPLEAGIARACETGLLVVSMGVLIVGVLLGWHHGVHHQPRHRSLLVLCLSLSVACFGLFNLAGFTLIEHWKQWLSVCSVTFLNEPASGHLQFELTVTRDRQVIQMVGRPSNGTASGLYAGEAHLTVKRDQRIVFSELLTLHPGQHLLYHLSPQMLAEFEKLQGRWIIEEPVITFRDKKTTAIDELWIEFDQDRVRFGRHCSGVSSAFVGGGTFGVTPLPKLGRLDLFLRAPGIYRFVDDKLQIVMAKPGESRPTQIPTIGKTLVVCRRLPDSDAQRPSPSSDVTATSNVSPSANIDLVQTLPVGSLVNRVLRPTAVRELVAVGQANAEDSIVKIWNSETLAESRVWRSEQPLRPFAWLSLANQIATVEADAPNGFRMRDDKTFELLTVFANHSLAVTSLAASLDGRWMASGDLGGSVVLWQHDPQKNSATTKGLSGHAGETTTLAFSPDGSLLASGSLDKTVRIFDVATGQLKHEFNRATDRITEVTFSADGQLLAVASWDRLIWILDPHAGQWTGSLRGPTDKATSVAFSPNGKLVAAGCFDGSLLVFDRAKGQIVARADAKQNEVLGVTFLDEQPQRQRLATAHRNGMVNIWRLSPSW